VLSSIHSIVYRNSNKIDQQTAEEIQKSVYTIDYTKNMGARIIFGMYKKINKMAQKAFLSFIGNGSI